VRSSLYESGLSAVEFNKDVEDFSQMRALADEPLMNPDIPFTLQVGVCVRPARSLLPRRERVLARHTKNNLVSTTSQAVAVYTFTA